MVEKVLLLQNGQVGSEAEAQDAGAVEVPPNVKDGALFLDALLLNLRKVACSPLLFVTHTKEQALCHDKPASARSVCGCNP